jgi:TolB protein
MQRFYTVRPRDTLYAIAARWQLPVESLIAANNLAPPYTIYIGQQLSVPPGVDLIRVRLGDTVFSISQFFKIPQEVIIEANQLQPPYIIQVDQLLKVPPGVPYYTVQRGDTLFHIARRFNVRTEGQINYELIKEVNQLPSNVIIAGQRLIIPYAPPGDKGLIAYISNRGGSFDLWLYNPRNGENLQLTTGLGEFFSNPFWSPDNSRIAFVGRNHILYIIRLADGGISRIDQFEEGAGIYLSWAPDSQRLAYTKQDEIMLYNVINHQFERINAPDATDAQWFPNGTELLFQAPDASGISQLYRISADGTGKQQITQNTGGRLNYVRLSPDGMFALYTTPGVSISIIFTVDLSTGKVFEVKGGPLAKNYFPEWSPNSSTIAYSATAYENVGYFSFIKTTKKHGEYDVIRAISNCFASPVTWSPDGRKIAYLSGCYNQEMSSEIWLFDITHPAPIQLIKGGLIASLKWSPMALSSLRKTFSNSVYHVHFQYPAQWKRVTDTRYEGPDGFFQLSAISSAETIDEVCRAEAFHQLLPYGSKPRITKTEIQNQEACMIHPSQDQPPEMRGQAALIVRYPTPIQIGDTIYHYFILWVNKEQLREISTTLSFI